MTLKQIEYFQAVCRSGNISSAAEQLYVSRSVVSRTITELEEEFGSALFTRSRSGVALTESGRILLRLFDTFTASCATAKRQIQLCQIQEPLLQPLRVGITPTNAYCIYKNYLEGFQSDHADVGLCITEYSAYEAFRPLLDGMIDVAFTPAKPDEDVFCSLDLYPNPVMLGAAEHDTRLGTTADISDLLDLPLGYFNAPMPLERMLTASFAAMGKNPNVVLRTSDQMLLRELTCQGRIYPILPLDMMATWAGVRQVSLDFFPLSTNRAVWSRALTPSPNLETFLLYMRRQLV